MKRIFIRKIFPYDPTMGGMYSRYQGYCKSCLQITSPVITSEAKINLSGKISSPIFCSSLKRGCQTGEAVSQELGVSLIKQLSELNEIKFDLRQLLSEEEFNELGSDLVRKRFIEAFISDSLFESRDQIKQRMDYIINMMRELPEGNYLLISHSFFMKLLQVYLKSHRLFQQPEGLKQYFDPGVRTFVHGDGFVFEL